ncbi:hypothetical protein FACS1894145_5890 [Bacteroidia bacterium]|nr:hypothetical protein FACS1894145_5890 [Bacteroidia bacterium]
MDDKFKHKYRIPPARAQWWNYGMNGAYFITICTKNREHFFGEIENNKMILSNIGVIANVFWHEIKKHHDFVELGEFVVMPNHVHGILIINKPENIEISNTVETRQCLVSTECNPEPEKTEGQKRFQNQGKQTISSIIGIYKSVVTYHAHRLGYDFEWQTRFHDHIIRDNEEYKNIENYIYANPQKWENDIYSKNK